MVYFSFVNNYFFILPVLDIFFHASSHILNFFWLISNARLPLILLFIFSPVTHVLVSFFSYHILVEYMIVLPVENRITCDFLDSNLLVTYLQFGTITISFLLLILSTFPVGFVIVGVYLETRQTSRLFSR